MGRQRSGALLCVSVALAIPVMADAQDLPLRGTWTINRQSSGDVNRAIESAVARMSFVTRPIARGRLRRTNVVPARLALDYTPQRVSTTFDSSRSIDSPANGQPIKWTREDGEKLDVTTEWQGRRLVQTFRAEDGSRTNTYSVSADGRRLMMHITVRSPRLSGPLEYNLVFDKAA